MIVQKFRVNKNTSFEDMKRAACKFWCLNPDHFTLVMPNMHEIMSMNSDPRHLGFYVQKYFELFKEKRPLMHLVRPNRHRIYDEVEIPKEEKKLIKIPW